MSDKKTYIGDAESIARAIFSPAMIDGSGKIAKAAFGLRHNEDYISVARMSVDCWLEDIKSIPVDENRKLVGYGELIVGDVRGIDVHFFDNKIVFDVEDKSSERNKSHAGITICCENTQLKGDKKLVLKPLQARQPASMLLLKIQSSLANIANKGFVMLV